MMHCTSVTYTSHALRRMFERQLSSEEVVYTLQTGDLVMDYPDDRPYPSQLLLGWVKGRAIHVVVSKNPASGECYVVTAYYPSLEIWNDDFKTRRS
ncbi:DUF4258 domain-containing protein [Marinobacter persicus]|uniref:Uncharacterized protein DUF4258 n=2 Tax=Marinobacter persicus TaxID=930118 RepID=A0A2S6G831_9GAMM|nr:DUF4258 domain-containing protein [Marinobacter persicus]PPK55359.1 uncharacterized protein DUF4258 [Marinobacter persicus]PPK59126.1 uncharacterized protein DUF4258 [Marinobacter persicus]